MLNLVVCTPRSSLLAGYAQEQLLEFVAPPRRKLTTTAKTPIYNGMTPPRMKANGAVLLDDREDYVGSQYAGQEVVAQLDAPTRQVCFVHQRQVLKVKPLRGLAGAEMTLEAFVAWCEHEARTVWRRYLASRHPFQRAS
jgi:hypothetical protein